MKFTEEKLTSANLIHSYESDRVQIGETQYRQSIIVSRDRLLSPWPVRHVDDLKSTHIDEITADKPDLVIIGTGQEHRWPDMAVIYEIGARGIGCEVMSTGSACRTYNVVAGEGRRVTAALIID
ncbi:MAG: Mth938-like domain-containing protein [Thiotrichales bacterium]